MSQTQKHYNFGAGPAMIPGGVLQEVQAELLNWHEQNMSILEVGARTQPFITLMDQLEALTRKLLNVPQNYHILFLGGPARLQFAMVPLNFLNADEQAGFYISGKWSLIAFQEACKLKKAYCLASSEGEEFKSLPITDNLSFHDNTRYVYYTPNETINGVRFNFIPPAGDAFFVADMTSCLLTEPFDISNFGLIFAGSQKNFGAANLTVVIVRDDLLSRPATEPLATMLDYRTQASYRSLYATPPIFNCYLAYKIMQWMEKQGGVNALYQLNVQKSQLLYDYIDNQQFYRVSIEKSARSLVNVCFTLADVKLESLFVQKAAERGLHALQGHRLVGGLRASLYNAMPLSGVEVLIHFMEDFAKEYG